MPNLATQISIDGAAIAASQQESKRRSATGAPLAAAAPSTSAAAYAVATGAAGQRRGTAQSMVTGDGSAVVADAAVADRSKYGAIPLKKAPDGVVSGEGDRQEGSSSEGE